VLGLVLLPLLVLGVSLRTCLVTASQHFPVVVIVVVELGEVVLVVVELCATATPMLPASMAAAITPIPIIRMRYLSCWGGGARSPPIAERRPMAAVPSCCVAKKSPGLAIEARCGLPVDCKKKPSGNAARLQFTRGKPSSVARGKTTPEL